MTRVNHVSFIPEHLACQLKPFKNWAMISITDSTPLYWIGYMASHMASKRIAALQSGWKHLLRLQFDDVDPRNHFDVHYEQDHFNLFAKEHALKILDFLKKIEEADVTTLVVHCYAGISRSAAVARFAAEYFQVPNFNYEYNLYNKFVYRILSNTQGLAFDPEQTAFKSIPEGLIP